LRFTSSN